MHSPTRQPIEPHPAREPMFNAPWEVVALVGVLIATHALRLGVAQVFHLSRDASLQYLELTREDLADWNLTPLVTYLFAHGSWAHVLLNAASVLAFGVPVARLYNSGPRGSLAFFGFFLACGVLAALGYAAIPSKTDWALVGASGAASGLVGAAARIMEGRGWLGPFLGRTVMAMTAAWIVVNAALGLSGLTPGAAGLPVAWQAHIIGYFAGLFLVGPFAWVAGAPPRSRYDHGLTP